MFANLRHDALRGLMKTNFCSSSSFAHNGLILGVKPGDSFNILSKIASFAHYCFNHHSTRPNSSELENGIAYKEPWTWVMPEGHDTGIKVKNSYRCTAGGTRNKVPLVVRDPSHVTWYACGPTVYDRSHIGHASTYIQFDLIRRILTHYFNLNICMVMGITNMDNKIINRAALYEKDLMELANKYENEFKEDMNSLNVLPPTAYIRVTDIIPQIIEFIQVVINKKRAYVTERGNVYFSYNSAHQSIAKLRGEFFEPEATIGDKRFIKDIILWKSPLPGEPYWDAPWGKGRPGWHIECSVMASMCFGDKVDIHSGANDLIYPHHEYEVAQCDAFHDCHQWVNYFLHTGHVQFGGDKMSKSLGNTISIKDFVNKFKEPDTLRMIGCEVEWSHSFVYTDSFAKRAHKNIKFFADTLKKCNYILSGQFHASVDNVALLKAIDDCDKDIRKNFMSNFNTAVALHNLKKFCTGIQKSVQKSTTNFSDVSALIKATNFLNNHLSNLGFSFHKRNSKI